ncbi:MAG: nucleoside deaminase [Candidatus Omnitrophica bacterium]|nr:nucleoside deaminase [Candidatus Omnitrophota bacterium]
MKESPWAGPERRHMRAAISAARRGIAKGQTPFGSCIVRGGRRICCAHNRVWQTTDITAHAEIVAIRRACAILRTVDLSGCVLYSTCEPCPMCLSAIHWARVPLLVFGARIADAANAGFNEILLSNEEFSRRGCLRVEIYADFMRAECGVLFSEWSAAKRASAY